jgi:hypothetical protein
LENRHDHQPTSPLPLGQGGGKGPFKKEKQGDVSERRETAQGVWYLGTKVVEKSKMAQTRPYIKLQIQESSQYCVPLPPFVIAEWEKVPKAEGGQYQTGAGQETCASEYTSDIICPPC